MKFKKALILILALVAVVALAAAVSACSSSVNVDGLTCVTYELEGGTYKNSTHPVKQYYDLKEGESVHISDPETMSNKEVARKGYSFLGWFKTKNADGTYSDEWNFESDELASGYELTLYANWSKNKTFYYAVCYIDETTGEEVELGRYIAAKGDVLNDINKLGNQRKGYTCTGYTDVYGNPWNDAFQHPGGENGATVKIYGKYLVGEYTLVSTANELKNAATQRKNILLTKDIDMGGISGFSGFGTAGKYSSVFDGGGFTVSNLKVDKTAGKSAVEYGASLFADLDGATIRNVKFTGVEFSIEAGVSKLTKLTIAPIAINAQNSKLEDVEFDGVYDIKHLNSGASTAITADKLVANEGQNVEITGEKLSFGAKGAGIAAAAYIFTANTYSKKEHLYEV